MTRSISLTKIKAYDDESEAYNIIVDTPKGSRNKFKYDETHNLFKLGGVLPVGASFPFDFGFVPLTRGGDGDPLDVLILMDEPAFPGCLIPAKLIGAIEAEQTEDGKTIRNDRLIAVATDSHGYKSIRSLSDVNSHLIDEIEHFFVSYNKERGREFKCLNRAETERAIEIVNEGMQSHRKAARK
jgi:inorganic pyrophosphatase